MLSENLMRLTIKETLDLLNWSFLFVIIIYLFKVIIFLEKYKVKNIFIGLILVLLGSFIGISYQFENFNKFVRLEGTILEYHWQDIINFLFVLFSFILGIFIIEFGKKERKLQEEYDINSQMTKLLQAVLDTTSHGICYVKDRRMKWFNKSITNMFGWTKDDLMDKDSAFLYETIEEYDMIGSKIDGQFDSKRSVYFEYSFLHKNGQRVPCIITGNMINKLKPRDGYIYSFTDITNYKKTLEDLAESEEKYRAIIENTDEAYYELTLDGIVTFANNAAINIFNLNTVDVINRRLSELLPEKVSDELIKVFESIRVSNNPLKNLHLKFKLKDEDRHIETSIIPKKKDGKIIGYRGVSRDITERQKMRDQIEESQRLASLGEMAAGMAHEINNPISGIITYAELLKDDLISNSEEHTFASEIVKEGNRIAKIIKNLLAFARKEEVEKSSNDIIEIINDSLSLFKANTKKHGVSIDTHFIKPIENIFCSKYQIQQVFINLLSNAIFSLNEKYPDVEEIDKIIKIKVFKCREYLRIEFKDYGTGMYPETIKRIFEPFYTTKRPDCGTGLGLSVSYGIIKDHNGKIRVESEYGKWAKFIIDLPQ